MTPIQFFFPHILWIIFLNIRKKTKRCLEFKKNFIAILRNQEFFNYFSKKILTVEIFLGGGYFSQR